MEDQAVLLHIGLGSGGMFRVSGHCWPLTVDVVRYECNLLFDATSFARCWSTGSSRLRHNPVSSEGQC